MVRKKKESKRDYADFFDGSPMNRNFIVGREELEGLHAGATVYLRRLESLMIDCGILTEKDSFTQGKR